jgi:hypothetical protein
MSAITGTSLGVGESASVRVCECASVRVCECASVRVCECASLRVCECASVRVCEFASVRVCGFARLWVAGRDRRLPLAARHSPLAARHSPLATRHSLTRNLLLQPVIQFVDLLEQGGGGGQQGFSQTPVFGFRYLTRLHVVIEIADTSHDGCLIGQQALSSRHGLRYTGMWHQQRPRDIETCQNEQHNDKNKRDHSFLPTIRPEAVQFGP